MQEHFDAGENDLHGTSLLSEMPSYDAWLDHLDKQSDPTLINPDWVTASTFLVIRKEDQKLIGLIDIRHELNEFLQSYGGHIGYGIRPTERKKGYAEEMLRLALAFCRDLGLEKVMLSCDRENLASKKTILKNGGVFEREFTYKPGEIIQIYWINLSE